MIIFDNPRVGFSNDTSTTSPLTVDYMANATVALIEALSLNRPDIIGNSMGGDIALALASKYGDSIGFVVSVAGSYGGPDAPQPDGGLASVLWDLETFFLAKTAGYAGLGSGFASSAANQSSFAQDQFKLFFPQGSLDPGNQKRSLSTHREGNTPLPCIPLYMDGNAGINLPSCTCLADSRAYCFSLIETIAKYIDISRYIEIPVRCPWRA